MSNNVIVWLVVVAISEMSAITTKMEREKRKYKVHKVKQF